MSGLFLHHFNESTINRRSYESFLFPFTLHLKATCAKYRYILLFTLRIYETSLFHARFLRFFRNFERVSFRESFEDTRRTFVVVRSFACPLQEQSGEPAASCEESNPCRGRCSATPVDKRGNILLTRSFAL